MAGRPTDLVDSDQTRISIAVKVDRLHFLNMATVFALAPELLATAAEVDDTTRAKRLVSCFLIHVGEHQHIALIIILCDGGNQIRIQTVGAVRGYLQLSRFIFILLLATQ